MISTMGDHMGETHRRARLWVPVPQALGLWARLCVPVGQALTLPATVGATVGSPVDQTFSNRYLFYNTHTVCRISPATTPASAEICATFPRHTTATNACLRKNVPKVTCVQGWSD